MTTPDILIGYSQSCKCFESVVQHVFVSGLVAQIKYEVALRC